MKNIAALFDCDGTLYSAQYGRGLMQYSADHERKGKANAYFISLILPHYLHKLGLIGDESYHRPIISRLAWMAKGMTKEEFEQVTNWIIKEYLLPTERPEIITRLRDHQSKGHLTLLVSGTPTTSLQVLGNHYQVFGIVGTTLEIKNGRYSGNITPPAITGADKEIYARKFYTEKGLDIDWEASYAYADSITDTGLFDMVGNPIAVYPDKKLHAVALSKKWEIIGEPKNK